MPAPRLFVARSASSIAPVATVPTTAAHFALYNAEPLNGGKTYTITSVGFTQDTSAAAAIQSQLLAHMGFGGNAQPPAGTAASGPFPCDGGPKSSLAVPLQAATIVVNGVWHPVGLSAISVSATASIGIGSYQRVDGIYTIPPGGLLSLAVFCSSAGSSKCLISCTWSEA